MNTFNFFSGNELNRSYERIRKIEDEKKSLQIWRAGLFWVKNSFLLLPMQKITIFISLNKKRKKSLSRTPMNPSGCANIGALVWHIFFNEKLFPKNKTTFLLVGALSQSQGFELDAKLHFCLHIEARNSFFQEILWAKLRERLIRSLCMCVVV